MTPNTATLTLNRHDQDLTVTLVHKGSWHINGAIQEDGSAATVP